MEKVTARLYRYGNAGVSKFFMKTNACKSPLPYTTCSTRNVGIRRSASLNYVEDERLASLGRYGMVKLTYALNSMAGGRGHGMRFIMRR
ncbi:MAG: hypothetical protein IPK76_16060 [Lewinellaceae bacterium]|nr:hypothetical protein [Lewinellaceae bacterium]